MSLKKFSFKLKKKNAIEVKFEVKDGSTKALGLHESHLRGCGWSEVEDGS
jgi:hypothetical protein